MTSPSPTSQSEEPGVPEVGGSGTAVAGAVLAVLAAAEVAIAAYMLSAYTKWLAEVVSRVLAGFLRFGVSPDPAAIWSTVPLWDALIDGLIDRLIPIARAGWIEAGRQLGVDIPFNAKDPLLQDLLHRTRNLMVRTPDEVYRSVIAALGHVSATGGTLEDQVRAVRHVLDVTGTENWPSRARTVSVTEVHRAWNFGAMAAAMRAQQQLQTPMNKRWVARDDSHTRIAHDKADGQIVPINQPFIVNMEALMMPGDPSGSPSNVINCRCKPYFTRRQG
jgi:hypothetical protein